MSKHTTIDQLKLLAQRSKTGIDAVDTKVTELSTKVDDLVTTGGEPNVIETVKVNGTALTVDADKAVDVTVPTNVSELTNDSKYQSDTEVSTAIQTAIAATGHASFKKADSVPDAADAEENVLYLVMNSSTGHYDIYAKVAGSTEGEYTMELLDDTTVDLTNYVTSEGLASAVDGLIKLTDISVNITGTGNAVTAIGYDNATGVFTVTMGVTFITEDDVATDEEVTTMLDEVFGTAS